MSENKQWIPCSERLPDKNGSYIAQVEESDGTAVLSFMVIEHCNEDGTWLHDFKGKKNYRKTIAWMPLPEPYSTDTQKPQTNADRIRSMTDDELAQTLFASCLEIMKLEECTNTDNCGVCKRCVLEWLQSEAE